MRSAGVTIVYEQVNDACDRSDLGQDLTVSVNDAGGGPYIVIQTDRWAIGESSDIDAFADELKRVLMMVEGRDD
jgi:hypothetical protein